MSQPEAFSLDPDTQQFLESYATGEVDWGTNPTAVQQRAVGLQLYNAGHYREAEFCLRAAHHLAKDERNSGLDSVIRLDLGRTLIQIAPREALRLLSTLKDEQSKDLNRVCLFVALGSTLMEFCQFDLADKSFHAAREEHARTPDEKFFTYEEANRARDSFQMGFTDLANQLSARAEKKLADTGEESSRGFVLANNAIHMTLQNRYDEAFSLFDKCMDIQSTARNERLAGLLDLGIAELEMVAGDLDLAHEKLTVGKMSDVVFPGVQARKLVWRSILDSPKDPSEFIKDLEAVARDLYALDLREDCSMIYMIASVYADSRGIADERLIETARSVFGPYQGFQFLANHYARIMASLYSRRCTRNDQELPRFLTQSPEVIDVKAKLHRLAKTDVRLLIEGESGTGKTFLARLVHEECERRDAPFIVVDCTNLEANLFESKLFGHVRGSFTGAVTDAIGLVEQANKGTLFLDEIGELPWDIQAKLLYTIEEQRYRPIGSRTEKQAEFRVIAATNRNIDEMLESGTLRRDLFFRIAGYRVMLPPLRHRREDIVPLVEHRLQAMNSRYGRRKILRSGVWEAIVIHEWPGNVRELNATLERGFHLSTGRYIDQEDLGLSSSTDMIPPDDLSWYQTRRAHLIRVLKLCRGNVTQAARMLGLNRTTLIYKLKLLDIQRKDFDSSRQKSKRSPPDDPLRWVAEADVENDDLDLDA